MGCKIPIYYYCYHTITRLGFIHAREMSGKFKFFQGQGIVREFCDVSGKNEILQRKCQGILYFSLDEAGMFGPDVFFVKFMKCLAPVLSGKFEFVSGKCQGIVREFWSVLNI